MDRKHVGTAYVGLNSRELAAGRGTFVNDIQPPGTAYLVVVRSIFAHARIVSVRDRTTGDTDEAFRTADRMASGRVRRILSPRDVWRAIRDARLATEWQGVGSGV